MPPRKSGNGVNWEALHKELGAMRLEFTSQMGAMESRLNIRVDAVGESFHAFTQETRESRMQTAALLVQLTADTKAAKAHCEGCPIEELQHDVTDMKIESARGDRRVGIIGTIITALGSLAAAIYGTSK